MKILFRMDFNLVESAPYQEACKWSLLASSSVDPPARCCLRNHCLIPLNWVGEVVAD
ncbi:MAG: hypothetical protein IKA23_06645 [Akkermansia sp.]|nr:hypothetical protein [Akkermansia sp.]